MQNQEIIKAKLQQSKVEIEAKSLDFSSNNSNVKIDLKLSQEINRIVFNGNTVDNELVDAINQAVALAKSSFEKEMHQVLIGLGLKM